MSAFGTCTTYRALTSVDPGASEGSRVCPSSHWRVRRCSINLWRRPQVGKAKLESGLEINYAGIQGFRIAGNKGVWLIAACQLPLMAGPEYARYVGIDSLQPVGVFLPGDQVYPGGAPFDPLGISERPDAFLDQQVRCGGTLRTCMPMGGEACLV